MGNTIALLEDFAAGPLPKVVSEPSQIPTIDILRGVGWVVADLPDRLSGPAIVREVTFAGRAVLFQAQRHAS